MSVCPLVCRFVIGNVGLCQKIAHFFCLVESVIFVNLLSLMFKKKCFRFCIGRREVTSHTTIGMNYVFVMGGAGGGSDAGGGGAGRGVGAG